MMRLWTQRLGITFTAIFIFFQPVQASFIEATIGTAVVNDATATYHNPAALTRLEGSQVVGLGTVAYFHSQFRGTARQPSGQMQFGVSNTNARYYLPSFYYALPVTEKVVMALGVVSNFFNTNPDGTSIIRYVEAGNDIQDINIIPALGVKLTDYLALGAAINLAHASMNMQPVSGFPALNIPDSESHNTASGNGVGADVGVLIKPAQATLVGLNYQSAVTYHFQGKSVLASNPDIFSNDYHFKFWTPARAVITIAKKVSPSLGFAFTAQRIQWSVFKNVKLYNVATQAGAAQTIVSAAVPYYLRNTWFLTLGSQYQIMPKWVLRMALGYNQTPGNGSYQITNGNSYILGVSTGYAISKTVSIDGGYAHAFIQTANININSRAVLVDGLTDGARDSVSLKITVNL